MRPPRVCGGGQRREGNFVSQLEAPTNAALFEKPVAGYNGQSPVSLLAGGIGRH